MNREITIGNADGLREANRPDFKELFYSDSRHYRDLKSDDCFVVLGRKGAGKTVLLKYFQIMNHSPKQLTLVNYFEFGEIKTDELIEFSFNNIDLEVRSHFQKYYLLKSAFSTINKFTKEIGIFNFIGEYGPVKGIINYRKYSRLVKEICSLDFMPKLEEVIRQEVEYNSSIGNSVSYKMDANLSGVSAGVGAGVTEEKTSKYNRVNYYTNFDYYKTLLEEVSAYLTIILLFDDLEEAPINLKTPEISYIADFIENIYRFNLELNNYNRKSRAVVAVREDLLKRMITSNSNISKKTEDTSVKLNWVKENKQDLEGLVMHKLRSTSHKFADYDDDQIAEEFFHVNKSSKGIIQSIPPLNRLISKTMSRPRDVVVFLNQILADKKIVSGDKITTDVVKKYEASASNYLENELISEMAAHFPNDNLLNSSMSVLRNIKQREFTGKKIFDAFIESGIEEESAKVSLQLLLQFCIIGKFKVNESPGFQMKSGDDKSRKIHKKIS